MLSILLLALTASTVIATQTQVVTWDALVRQHCRSTPFSRSISHAGRVAPRRGARGPNGKTGRVGRPGRPGVQGSMGDRSNANETLLKQIFDESLEKVLQNEQRSFVMSIPADFDAKTAYQSTKFFPTYSDWTVFQRRTDGSVEFYRGWNDYVNGFGDKHGEFWLGLQEIHQLTKTGFHELKVTMIEKDGTFRTANYGYFKISSAAENYKLHVNSYSGNATDSLGYHSMWAFSTHDADHDRSGGNCAFNSKGAWWYKDCQYSNLNGKYRRRSTTKGLRWYHHGEERNMYMKFTEMKFRSVFL